MKNEIHKILFTIICCIFGLMVFIDLIQDSYLKGIPIWKIDESVVEESFPIRNVVRETYGLVNKILSPNEIVDETIGVTVRDEDGFLEVMTMNSLDINGATDKIGELNSFCKDRNIFFSYISFPSKSDSSEDSLQYGIDVNNEELRLEFLSCIEEKSVSMLDIRALMEREEYTVKDIFYKTDHHWTTDAGLFAARSIVDYLNSRGYQLDGNLLEESCFQKIVYEDCWLGETGRKFSKTWTGELDDFSLIRPVYETSFEYNGRSGDFSVLLNGAVYGTQNDLYTTSMHYSYCYGAGSPTLIHNNKINGPKILLIHDSFSMVVAPFLALVSEDVVMWDMRKTPEGLYEYIESQDFDIVLVAYTDFWSEKMYNFN